MKGGFYGLRAKQLSLVLFAVVCTIILIFGWAKTPILSSLIPPQSNVLHLPSVTTDEEAINKQVSGGLNGSDGLSERIGITTNISSFVNVDKKKRSTHVTVTNQDNSTKAVEVSGGESSSEHKNRSEHSVDLLSPVEVSGGKSSSERVVDKVPPVEVSGRKNSSEHVDLVPPVGSSHKNSSLKGHKDNTVTTPTKSKACNYAKGKWIVDDNRPLYSGFGCKQWLSSMWACRLTQRTDFAYEKLRWQPKDCEMEDFTSSKFLKRMQNKTLAFIGDSLGRQQFQSLMCMVTGGEERPDVLDVGWEYGLVKARGHVRPDGWAYRFPSTNSTVLYYWSASLCDLELLDIMNPATEVAMHLDRPPAFLQRFIHKFDVLVLNTGHHWNRGKLNANRWVIHVGGKRNTDRKIADIGGAKNFTIYSIVNWVNSELPKYPGLKAFYRSISPRHFFNGDWNTGGTCDNTSPSSGVLEVLRDESIDPQAAGAVKGTNVKLLDITAISQLRDEGHISRYSIKATPGVQDCLHWCLPGVPDTWNELLFAQI